MNCRTEGLGAFFAPWHWIVVCCAGVGGLCFCSLSIPVVAQVAEPPAGQLRELRVPRSGMDRFDMRAAEDAGKSEKLALVRKSFERQRWDDGVQQLQRVLDDDQDSLVFGEDHAWRPASEVALELIGQFPAQARQAYDERFGVLAERDRSKASQGRDLPALARIARRYLLTSAGQWASRELIDATIDHGNGDALAKQVHDLMRVDSALLRDTEWRDQLATVLHGTGYQRLTSQLIELTATAPQTGARPRLWSLDRFAIKPALLENWTSVSGSSTGQGVARTPDSSLLPHWRNRLITHPRIRRLLQEQRLDFEDEGKLGLSVLSTVGSGDILVTRTLLHLSAVNVSTGKTLWTSGEWGRPTIDEDESSDEIQHLFEPNIERENEGSLRYQIRNRLTMGGSLGSLSMNSRYVFALASFAAEEPYLEGMVPSGFDESLTAQTYLYARDLKTGRIAWRAGGSVMEEPPGLPAAGVFFFGPPTADGDELFAVGERDGDILLFCMEAETGFVRWEQLLAAAGRRLIEDGIRRSWAAPVAVRGSLIVCPTTTGWLTAVDRVSRKLLWSVRMVPRLKADSDSQESDLTFDIPNRETSLDERWPPLQPILLRDRVIVAPIEFPDEMGNTQPRLFCFDLSSGEKQWELPKEQLVGVIGASQEWLYLFDRASVRAILIATGTPAWKCPIKEFVSGRPLLTHTGIVVPTQAGTLVRVNPVDGAIIGHTQISNDSNQEMMGSQRLIPSGPRESSLGNLLSVGGRLVSVSPVEMMAFEWTADEALWQAKSRTDAESAIRWAQSLALKGQWTEAAQVLREAAPLAMPDSSLASPLRQTLLDVLLLGLESESQRSGMVATWRTRLDEAKSLATAPEDREALQRLEIELCIQSAEWDNAWEQIRQLIRQPLQRPVEVDQRIMHPDVWLADRVLSLGQSPDRDERTARRQTIRDEFQSLWKAAGGDRAGQERLLRLFSETPFVDLAELDALAPANAPQALSRLQALAKSRDRLTAQQAALRLIEQLATPDWVGEARVRLGALAPGEGWPQELRDDHSKLKQKLAEISDIHQQPIPSWRVGQIELLRHPTDATRPSDMGRPLFWIGEPCEALVNFSYFFDESFENVIIERADGSRYGELPLASNSENPLAQTAPVLYGSGLNVYLMYRGVIHAFSIPEKRLLWRRNRSPQLDQEAHWSTMNNSPGLLRHPDAMRGIRLDSSESSGLLVFEAANSRQLVVRTRRGIEVLCALTGQVLWEMPRCPSGTVRCDEDHLFRETGSQPVVFSIRSGRPVLAPDLSGFTENLLSLDPSGFTTMSERPGDGRTWQVEGHRLRGEPIAGGTQVERDRWDEQDLLNVETVWSQPRSTDSWLGAGPPGQGVSVEKSGEVELIEWSTGRRTPLGKMQFSDATGLPIGESKWRLNAQWDRFHLYLMADVSAEDRSWDFPAVSVNGRLSAHSRDRSTPDWSVTQNGFLMIQSLHRFPCLPILRLEDVLVAGFNTQRIHLTLLDKQTGKVLHELDTPSWGAGASGAHYEPLSQRWDLFLSNERLRFQFHPAPPL